MPFLHQCQTGGMTEVLSSAASVVSDWDMRHPGSISYSAAETWASHSLSAYSLQSGGGYDEMEEWKAMLQPFWVLIGEKSGI